MTFATNPAAKELAANIITGASLFVIIGGGMTLYQMHVQKRIDDKELTALTKFYEQKDNDTAT